MCKSHTRVREVMHTQYRKHAGTAAGHAQHRRRCSCRRIAPPWLQRWLAPFVASSNVPRRRQPTSFDGEACSCTLDLYEHVGEIWMVGCAHRLGSARRQRGATRHPRSRRRRSDGSAKRSNHHRREPQTRASASSRHATSTSRHFLRLGIRLIPATRCSKP